MRAIRYLGALIALLALLLIVSSPVLAVDTKYDAMETGDTAAASIYGANWYAQSFTTTYAYSVNSIRLLIYRNGSPGTLTVSIKATATSDPDGADLAVGTIDCDTITEDTDGLWYQVDFDAPYSLEAGVMYAIVVRATAGDGSNYVGWRYDATGTLADGNYESSINQGVTWSAEAGYDFMFSNWGATVIEIIDVKVFSSYYEDDDWLICVYYRNEYPPYYSDGSASQDYFDLQLLDTDGTTVLAQVKLAGWGCKPQAIYLNSGEASALEWGSAYFVQMYGRFGANPAVDVELTADMWSGSDLTILDSWCLSTANQMAIYYDVAMTAYVDYSEVLNSTGGTFFVIGIPALGEIRPDLFEYPPTEVTYEETTWTHTYEDSFDWETAFGTTIVSDATSFGAVFGLSGKETAQAVFFATWFIAVGIVGAVIGSPALFVTLPFQIIGVMTGLLPLSVFAILTSIVVFVLIWLFWFRST